MSTIGVDKLLDERWELGVPECGLDSCEACGACLGCWAFEPCVTGSVFDDPTDRHVWLNSREEVKTL